MSNMKHQQPVIIPPDVRYEYEYSYSYSPKLTVPKKNVNQLDDNRSVRGSPLDLLSSAASAVIDDETASLASSSSQTNRSRSSTPPPSPPKSQALPRRPPIAYAVPPSPPIAYAVLPSPPAHFPTATAVAPHQHLRSTPFGHISQRQSFAMPPGIEITLSHPPCTPPPPPPPPVIPHEITTGNNSNWKLPRKSSIMKAKRQQPKYKMKFQYVSMKRSEAVKYIEALSKSHHEMPLSYYHPGNYKHMPVPPGLSSANYHLPVATAFAPRH